jgi:hypothetical protein
MAISANAIARRAIAAASLILLAIETLARSVAQPWHRDCSYGNSETRHFSH